MKLTAVFEPAKEGGYTCFVEEVPAAISQGETLREARPVSVLTFDTFQQRTEGTSEVSSWGFRPATRVVP